MPWCLFHGPWPPTCTFTMACITGNGYVLTYYLHGLAHCLPQWCLLNEWMNECISPTELKSQELQIPTFLLARSWGWLFWKGLVHQALDVVQLLHLLLDTAVSATSFLCSVHGGEGFLCTSVCSFYEAPIGYCLFQSFSWSLRKRGVSELEGIWVTLPRFALRSVLTGYDPVSQAPKLPAVGEVAIIGGSL